MYEAVPCKEEYEHYDKWIWVGDSRIVGMAGSLPITYLAKSAMGLDWIRENIDELYDFEETNIVFNFGINDIGNVYNYANFYNNLPEDFIKKNKIFILSVNPVDEKKEVSYGYYSSNSVIEWFNENLRINLRNDFYYLDSFHYLVNDGFGTTDGIHYDHNTNIKICQFVENTVSGNNKE